MLLLLFSFGLPPLFAFENSYLVKGVDDDGLTMEGGLYGTDGNPYVSGNLTDANGDIHSFQGYRMGCCQVCGETDDGIRLKLREFDD